MASGLGGKMAGHAILFGNISNNLGKVKQEHITLLAVCIAAKHIHAAKSIIFFYMLALHVPIFHHLKKR
jgi:hypothetical protein